MCLIDMVIEHNKDLENTLFYFDPPYYVEGHSLYVDYYKKTHHQIVSNKIKQMQNAHWIVSYDDAPEIRSLYSDCQMKTSSARAST